MSEDWTEGEPLEQAAEMAARTVRAAGQAKNIAHTIQAAHQAAGAASGTVSGTAAGTALGGPLGAVIGGVLASKTFWKAAGSIFAGVLLFLYLIVNSISLIFSYLGFEDADSYVSQAREAECENIRNQIDKLFEENPEIKAEICTLIEAQRDEQFNEIETDFFDNWDGYDDYEVEEDEYESTLKPNLSQYLSVLIEETWSGSQIVSFYGYRYSWNGSLGGDLSSPYDEYFNLAAATYQVPVNLLKAMGKAESEFDPNAVSEAGAMGIMQLMPSTAANLGVTDPFNPKQNIMGGARYVAELLRTFSAYPNGLELAIAGYNAGPNAVRRAGYRIPQNGETPNYVAKVLNYLAAAGSSGMDGLDGNVGAGEEPPETVLPEMTLEHTYIPDNVQGNVEISGILLKELVEQQAAAFLDWTVTGTHTETVGEDEEEEEIEIVDYAVIVKLNPRLTEMQSGYSFRYVTDQTTFNYVLTLFDMLQSGTEGIQDMLFKMASWKNYVWGAGASEDIYTSTIYTGGDRIQYETVRGCVHEVIYYNQGEEPWASLSYGSSNIRSSGCGPTALAIAISTLKGEMVTPQITAKYAIDHGEYVAGAGTSHSFPSNAAGNWGLSAERVRRERMDYVVSELKQGKLAIVICAENTIAGSSGHYIVLTGVTAEGYITIADPGSRSRTGNLYAPATIQSYARNLSEGSIWIIGDN